MKILIEDAVLFLLCINILSGIVFSADIFNTTFHDQRWNSTTNSMETYVKPYTPSIFGNTNYFNESLSRYGTNNQTNATNPANLLGVSGIGVVNMLGYYLGFLTSVLSSPMLGFMLTPFVGAEFANVIGFILNVAFLIVAIRVISGRLRWS